MLMQIGDNMTTDMDSGDIHFISGWSEPKNTIKRKTSMDASF